MQFRDIIQVIVTPPAILDNYLGYEVGNALDNLILEICPQQPIQEFTPPPT